MICDSWMNWVTVDGTQIVVQPCFIILPPVSPVRTMACMPRECAYSSARSTFSELPDVEIPTTMSPALPGACTWRSNTPAKPKSFPFAVRKLESVVSAIAAHPGR